MNYLIKKKKYKIKHNNRIVVFIFDINKPNFNSGGVVNHTQGTLSSFLKNLIK